MLLERLRSDPHNAVVEIASGLTSSATGAGPLAGMPIAVKDLIDVAGMPTRCGSDVRADAEPAARDALVVERLRSAGAVIAAKTHTHEFGLGPTGDVSASGPCRNPHDRALITGGSSSGSAALIAAGVLPAALGTDTGCSVRTPASHCGIVGFKPSRGSLPRVGVFPVSPTCDHVGILGRDVETTAAVFAAAAGRQVHTDISVQNLRIGLANGSYWEVEDPAIADGVQAAAATLEDAGMTLTQVSTPGIEELAECYGPIVRTESYRIHRAWLESCPDRYQSPTLASLLEAADQPEHQYRASMRARRGIGKTLLTRLREQNVDILLTPTTAVRATPIGAQLVRQPDGTAIGIWSALLAMCLPFNLLGVPAISVPAPGIRGLPAGAQLVGVTTPDEVVLAVASRLMPIR